VIGLGAMLILSAPAPAIAAGHLARQVGGADYRAQRQSLIKLSRKIEISFDQERLEDVLTFIEDYSGADLDPLWTSERAAEGLDKDQLISLEVHNVPVLTLLELVLNKATGEFAEPDSNTWQLTPWGSVEVGPKERLNRRKRTEVYDINDLLFEIPEYPDVPEIDLESVLQQSSSGGGGGNAQSPFDDEDNNTNEDDQRTRQERADDIINLITLLVEPDQWVEGGGEGGTIRYYQGQLIVRAPDYMHRQLNGYPFWPSRLTSVTRRGGKRYVSLNMETGTSKIDGFGQQPVTAVVGGELRSSNPGGGG